MVKIICKALSGKKFEVSPEVIMFSLGLVWNLSGKTKNEYQRKMLQEIHRILSAVIYGSVTKIDV